MPTVRDAVVKLLADLGLTTIFGNPGSTELPLLRDFPPAVPLHSGANLRPDNLRRNLVTRGISLNDLVGDPVHVHGD